MYNGHLNLKVYADASRTRVIAHGQGSLRPSLRQQRNKTYLAYKVPLILTTTQIAFGSVILLIKLHSH